MSTLRGCVLLFVLVLSAPPCRGQGSGCSCDVPNSRCDESGVCRCDPGWGGPHCAVCLLMPGCLHGSCQQPWQCRCDPGWGGRFCDKDLQVCSQHPPCLNGASCVMEDSGDYSCLCPKGFHGRNCELKTGPCLQSRSPCKNGGLCEDADGFSAVLRCRCLAGFAGPRCETDLDDCLMKPCANGASCLDGVNRFSCFCPPGFSGRFCTVNLDDCAGRPCLHAGRCLDRAAGFLCVCRPGFGGATCQTALRAGEPGRTTGAGNHSSHDDRVFKVTVSERSAGSLSGVQLIILLVLGGGALAAVLLTTGLLLQGRCRARGLETSRAGETEVQISFLNVAEPEKKKLNTEVI
ncbi:protein delta homolog 2 [Eleginops maclovinus]